MWKYIQYGLKWGLRGLVIFSHFSFFYISFRLILSYSVGKGGRIWIIHEGLLLITRRKCQRRMEEVSVLRHIWQWHWIKLWKFRRLTKNSFFWAVTFLLVLFAHFFLLLLRGAALSCYNCIPNWVRPASAANLAPKDGKDMVGYLVR